MSLLALLVIIVVVGAIVWLIYRAPFISPPFKTAAMIVALVVVGVLILNAFGVIDALRGVTVPKVHK